MYFAKRETLRLKMAALVAGSLAGFPAASQAEATSTLLLGVVRNGHFDARLSARLADHLEHVGEPLLKSARVGSAEHLCADGECMDQTARREGAGHVMTVQISAERSAPPFIRLALLDTESHRLISKEGICDPCTGDAMGLALESLTDRAFVDLRQPPASIIDSPILPPDRRPASTPERTSTDGLPVSSAPSSLSTPLAPASTRPYPVGVSATAAPTLWQRLDALPRGRQIGAGVLGGVSAVALISSIALAATSGHYTSLGCATDSAVNRTGQCRLNNAVPMGIGFSIGIAAAAGGLGLLVWPVKETRLEPSMNGNAAAQEY